MLRPDVRIFAPFALLASALLSQTPQNPPKSTTPSNFDRQVLPVLSKNCAVCHNDRNPSGGLNLGIFAMPSSLATHRDEWERIIAKMRSGEMPPKGLPKPSEAQLAALYAHVESEFEKADRALKPDPGRVTARRLNRNEYTNTIRDLLAVDFRADKDFPTDDSGYGFDNIGDVLTISPILMEKYVRAAERIAARAIGGDPLPKKPLEVEFSTKGQPLRRLDINTIELAHRIDWDGEYKIIIGLPGERPKDAKPVELAFYMDGKLLHSQMAETKPSGLVYFNPFSAEEMKLVIPEGDHIFRVAFLNDDFPKALTEKEQRDDKKNKRIGAVTFIGPFPAQIEKASRKKLLSCDPATGKACVDKIVSALARRAYRRPVTRAEVASLTKFVDLAKSEGLNAEQGVQLAIQAMLTSPHFLFRIEHDPDPTDPAKVHRIADIELASRLSYFLWTSTPDDELLALAEQKKLAANLDAQVKRMLADPRSATLADNFAGQWLEIRNLDSIKPDPQKFPEWGPELRDAMKTETRLFFEAMLRENRPMADFLDAPFTYLNERLAKHYGIPGVTGPDFRKVELTTPERGGILSHASVLTVSSYPTRTSPVIRGKYVLQNIMGAPPPPPPPTFPRWRKRVAS